jgi:3-dehydroquinate synthase
MTMWSSRQGIRAVLVALWAVVGTTRGFVAPTATTRSHAQLAFGRGALSASNNEYDVVKVDLDDGRDYPIYIGAGFGEDEAATLLKSHVKGNRVLIVTNDRISPMYLEKYERLFKDDSIAVGT